MAVVAALKSTIGRAEMMARLERTAPALAAALVERHALRLRSRRRAGPAAATSTDEGGRLRRSLAVTADTTEAGRSARVVVRGFAWGRPVSASSRPVGPGPARVTGVVLLVHDLDGSLDDLVPLVSALRRAGHGVVAVDAPGHGRSGAGSGRGGGDHVVEHARALRALAAVVGPLDAVVAHGAGALATSLALAEGWLHTPRLVLLEPELSVGRLLDRATAGTVPGPRTRQEVLARSRRRTGFPVSSLDVAGLVSGLGHRLAPALGVELARDLARPELFVVRSTSAVDPDPAAPDLVDGWPRARVLGVPAAGRALIDDAGVAAAVAWFATHGPVVLELPGGGSLSTPPAGRGV